MCMPTTKPSLIKAVLELLKVEFVPNNVKFSAHDVTARLRELVLQQAVIGAVYPIDTTETGTVMVQGNRVARIEHEDVRQIVHEYFDSGELSGYSREQTNGYFEYFPDQPADLLFGTITGRMSVANPPQANDPKPDPITPSTGPWSVL